MLALKLHRVLAGNPEYAHRHQTAEGYEKPVPPAGYAATASSPEGFQGSPGTTVRCDEHTQPQPDALPAGRQSVEVGGHTCRADGRDTDVLFAHLLGESYRKTTQVGFAGAVQRQQILPAWFFGSFRQGGARTEHPCHGRLPGRCGHRPLRTAAPLAAHRAAAGCAHHTGQLCPASLESPLARTPLLRTRLVEPAFHTLLPSDADVRTPGCPQVHDEASTLTHRTR